MVAGCSEHPATLISRRRSLSAEILHSSNLSNVIHKQPLLLESEGTRSREHSRCARALRFLQQYRHSNVFPLSIFPIKQKTAFSGFESVRIILETRNIVHLKCGDPIFSNSNSKTLVVLRPNPIFSTRMRQFCTLTGAE